MRAPGRPPSPPLRGHRGTQEAEAPALSQSRAASPKFRPTLGGWCCSFPAPPRALFAIKGRQYGIHPSRDKKFTLGREEDAQALPERTRGRSPHHRGGAGVAASPQLLEMERRDGHPEPGEHASLRLAAFVGDLGALSSLDMRCRGNTPLCFEGPGQVQFLPRCGLQTGVRRPPPSLRSGTTNSAAGPARESPSSVGAPISRRLQSQAPGSRAQALRGWDSGARGRRGDGRCTHRTSWLLLVPLLDPGLRSPLTADTPERARASGPYNRSPAPGAGAGRGLLPPVRSPLAAGCRDNGGHKAPESLHAAGEGRLPGCNTCVQETGWWSQRAS